MNGIGLTIALVAAGAWAFLIGVADAIREERRQ